MDTDLDFLNDDYQQPEAPAAAVEETVETPADDVETLKAKLAESERKLGSVGFIVEELEKDPAKLYDVKAALVGQPRPQQQQYQPQYQAPPAPVVNPQQQQADLQARLASVKDEFNKKALVEGDLFGAMMGVLLPVVQNSQQQTALQVGSSTASIVINNFISAKRSSDPSFGKVEAYFTQRLNQIPHQQLATMSADMINQTLSVAYDAACGQLFQEAQARHIAQKPAPRIAEAPTYGGGGRAAEPARSPGGASEYTKDELELAKALGLSPDDLKE